MRKQDRLLLMIAVCGELPSKLTGQVVGSDSYAAALITKLKQEGLIAVRSGEGYRGYVLKAKGRLYVLETYGPDAAFFLRGVAGRGHVKSEVHKRVRLHRMSEVWVFFWKAGVCIFQSQKPTLGSGSGENGVEEAAYYGSLEFKADFEAIKGSRACRVLLSGNPVFLCELLESDGGILFQKREFNICRMSGSAAWLMEECGIFPESSMRTG